MMKTLFQLVGYKEAMGMGTYNYTFKSVVFESVKVKSVKIKKSSEALEWSKKSFMRRFENYTFESVFF